MVQDAFIKPDDIVQGESREQRNIVEAEILTSPKEIHFSKLAVQ